MKMNTKRITAIKKNIEEIEALTPKELENTEVTPEHIKNLNAELELLEALKELRWEQIGGSAITVYNNTLMDCPLSIDNSFDLEEAGEVTAPENQHFLSKVNEKFGTEFLMKQFSGR